MNSNNPPTPNWYRKFLEKYPQVGKDYEALGKSVHEAGPLEERERALIKLGISGAARSLQAFRRHVHKAHTLGLSRDEIEHAVLLTLPTIGFPQMMTLLYIVDEEWQKIL
jgi:alkylhydroperoxidase/carboxymuconolactone decarboxylase family protein YurZ